MIDRPATSPDVRLHDDATAAGPHVAATATPPASAGRLPALDVLRGIAIFGTLGTNIWIFTAEVGSDVVLAPEWLGLVGSWVTNGKFLGLLTVMFGIGLEIQRRSALRAGRRWPGTYPIRAGLLFLDGLLNYIFVVQFDVLRAYAVTGLVVAFLLLTSERVRWWLIGVFAVAHLAFLTEISTGLLSFLSFDGAVGTWEDTGYWSNVVGTATYLWDGFSPSSEFWTIVLMGIALFLLGSKLFSAGVFEPRGRTLRRWLIASGVVALGVDAFFTFTDLFDGLLRDFARYGTAPIVALGLLALVAEFYQRRTPGRVGRVVSRVGRMALSCYLLQNVLGVIVQYALARPGHLAQIDTVYGTFVIYIVICALLLVFAAVWLRFFDRGPFELVWNRAFRFLARERRPHADAAQAG